MQILFYSNHCPHSNRAIQELDRTGILTKLKKVCVDRNPTTKARHPFVSQFGISNVPSIVWGDQKFTGTKVFAWISQVSDISGNSTRMERHKEPQSRGAPPAVTRQLGEMEGFSSDSNFASLTDSNLINPPAETSGTIQKTEGFVVPGELLSPNDRRRAQDTSSSSSSTTKGGSGGDPTKEYQRLLEERERQVPNIPKII